MLAAFFFQKLPAQLAYDFQGDIADKWLSRGAFLAWMLLPQLCFTALAFIIVRMVMLAARYWPPDSRPLFRLLPVMGNLVALPQIILTFAMLDILLYNAYQIKLIPLWIPTVIIMVLGAAFLGVFFAKTIREARRLQAANRQK